MAARYGHFKIVEFLAILVDNPNAPGPVGRTTLQLAAQGGHAEVIISLLKIICEKIPSNQQDIMNTLL